MPERRPTSHGGVGRSSRPRTRVNAALARGTAARTGASWASGFWVAAGSDRAGGLLRDLRASCRCRSTTKADPCSALASTMDNYGIDDHAAKLFASARPPPAQAQRCPIGHQAEVQPGNGCRTARSTRGRAMPSSRHLLGTDASGRDILSRVIWGGRGCR